MYGNVTECFCGTGQAQLSEMLFQQCLVDVVLSGSHQPCPVADLPQSDAAVQEVEESVHEDVEYIERRRRQGNGTSAYFFRLDLLRIPLLDKAPEVTVGYRVVHAQEYAVVSMWMPCSE